MAQQNNIAQQLNDLLVTRNFHPDMLDAQGKVCDSEDAKTFTFNYISGAGKNYGTMVVILDSDNDLKAFYGDNLGRSMEGDDKDEFFDFQQHLSQFANAHRYTYTAKDLGQLKHTMQGLAAIKEGLFEGYYGTRRISYAGEPTEARLMIRHNRNLGENDARFRYVESIFVETAEGERYRLPFTNLAGGRAMLEHVRQGGKPYDVRGNHICEMITELKVLTRFNRASQGRVLEGIKQGVVEGAQTYYKSLRESIKRMASPRGYTAYFESWHPANITEQDQLVEDIKTLFVEQTIDDRIEQALPLLAKIQRGREMKEADIFENWVNTLAEGTWSLPETPEQLNKLKELMSGELIVGPDGTNATEQLYDLIGDDVLFDRISELAAQDPRANLWDDSVVQARMQELGIQMPDNAAPDAMAQPQQAVAEEFVDQSPDETMDDPDQDDRMANFQKIGQPMDARVGGQRTTNGPDYQERTASVTGPDNRGMHKVTVTRNDDIASNYLTKNPPNNSRFFVSKDTNEADNISTFESLQRMANLAGVPLKENALNDNGSTLDYIMTTYQRDIKDFVQNGDMSEHLYDALYDYYFDDMPYGVKKARTGDPYEWISDRFRNDLGGADMVDEDQPRSKLMRQMPAGGFPVTDTPFTAANRVVGALDLTNQQTTPDPLASMKKAAGMATAPISAATGMSSDLQDQRNRIMRMAARDQMTQDQRDRIIRMAQEMPDTTPDNTTGASGYYDSNGILHIDMSAGLEESAPLEECNYTMENNYCPVHGLKECWLEEMNQSILATGSRLIEDLDEGLMGTLATKYGPKIAAPVSAALAGIGLGSVIDKSLPSDNSFSDSVRASINKVDKIKGTGSTQGSSFKDPFDGPFARPVDEGGMPGMGAALRGAGELGGKAANAVKDMITKISPGHPDYPLLQAARNQEQGNMKVWNKRYPDTPWTSQSDTDLLKSFNHDQNVQKGFGQFQRDAMPNDYSPTGYTRAQKSKGAAIDAQNSMQGNQDLFKNAYGIDEDMTDVGDVVGQAARSVTDRLGQAASDVYEPIGNFFKGVKQGYNGKAQTAQNTAAVAMPVRSPDIIAYDLPAPDTSVIDPDLDEADMMNPEIPSDFGSDSHLRDLLKLSGAYQAGDRSALKKSNDAMLARMTRSDPPTATPSFSAPGAAHDGQGGYDYSDEEPDQSDAETARLARFSVSDEPKGQAHAGQGGYDYSDEEPDQSDAETARLGRSINYESREGDALLARIKSLALIR
jgi:hypothetical protein